MNRFGDSLMRGLTRFNLPQRVMPDDLVDEARRVHTDAFDRDKDKTDLLGPMTAREEKLFKMGGFQAVIEDRRFRAKEQGDPTWNEIGKTRYTIERDIDAQTTDQQGMVPTGQGPATVPGQTGQGETENPRPLSLPVLLQADRPVGSGPAKEAVRAGRGDQTVEAKSADQSTPSPTRDTGTVPKRSTGPSTQPSRQAHGQAQQLPPSSDLVQALRGADRQGVGSRDGSEVEAFTPLVKRGGRPRKYATDAERKRAYRQRHRRRQ